MKKQFSTIIEICILIGTVLSFLNAIDVMDNKKRIESIELNIERSDV